MYLTVLQDSTWSSETTGKILRESHNSCFVRPWLVTMRIELVCSGFECLYLIVSSIADYLLTSSRSELCCGFVTVVDRDLDPNPEIGRLGEVRYRSGCRRRAETIDRVNRCRTILGMKAKQAAKKSRYVARNFRIRQEFECTAQVQQGNLSGLLPSWRCTIRRWISHTRHPITA